ncbi:Pre-mRNA-splicing factor RSE1 [Zancudomyces culisetae]|uniref:Pre-mRNA-splicing factor RSE1 n=1 Tax=Zancudomyces culisetae TaxID=1213189 RepID=A0A1R1PHS1_ZANCU|nr:Pre-mRNA-splicing factor RSE1 [Zancudomyces culisetae]OMH81533.1 Pre-mRNA-splicing factor RSE1 [Zancudomyces culisetae]|eukprot:OMH80521.1 Pre-mRNA-splicing factor RSE1 [Zancudomyces culisetae]
MYLYNVELQSATAVEHACVGHFRGRRTQELVLARNDRIELWEIETTTGKLVEIHSENVMGKIRSLITFRLTGGSKV